MELVMSKTTDFKKVDRLVDTAIADGLMLIGKDVKKRAIILAPIDSGDLRQSAKVEMKIPLRDTVEVSFNTAYAKRRHYENMLHPSTRLYLNNALKSITNVKRYFRKIF